MSKVLVVCARQYNGHELWTALGVMNEFGHEFEVVSSANYIEDEVTFQPNVIERTLDDIAPNIFEDEGFKGIMIVSGNMADTEAYWDDERVLSLIRKAGELDLPVSAICCSVPTIREVAKGKKVSFFPLVRSKLRLREAGAILQTVAITVDGKLVTAEHQMASQMWAECFSQVLNGEEPELKLVDSKYMPKGRPRKPIPGAAEAESALAGMTDFYVTEGLSEETIKEYADKIKRSVGIHYHKQNEMCNTRCTEYAP